MERSGLVSGITRNFVILLVLYTVWIFIGGIIFIHLEENCADQTESLENKMNGLSQSFCNELQGIISSYLKDDDTRISFMQSISRLMKTYNVGNNSRHYGTENNICNTSLSNLPQIPANCTKWTLGNLIKWVAFSSSTIFTIGYGSPTPSSDAGRITMVIYALMGMPIALAMLGLGGQLIIDKLSMCIDICEKKSSRTEQKRRDHVKVLFAAFISFALSIFGGCIITVNGHLSHLPWTISLYYWFQTVTTIGYGDIPIVRGFYLGWRCIILIPYTLCVIIGLALMSALLNLVATIILTGEWREYCCKKTFDSREDAEGPAELSLVQQNDESSDEIRLMVEDDAVFSTNDRLTEDNISPLISFGVTTDISGDTVYG